MKNIHLIQTDKLSRLGRFIDTNNLFLRTTNDIPRGENIDIYITSDEEIKEEVYGLIGKEVGKIILTRDGYEFLIGKGVSYEYGDYHSLQKVCKKIILTTDQDLINDGVQAINDEFLEWFVKNPSCEKVGVVKEMYMPQSNGKISDGKITHELSLNPSDNTLPFYKIIIPQEEPNKTHHLDELPNMDKDVVLKMYNAAIPKLESKQETLEEAAFHYSKHKINKNTSLLDFTNGAKWQSERMYSEEEVIELLQKMNDWPTTFIGRIDIREWFEQFKKK